MWNSFGFINLVTSLNLGHAGKWVSAWQSLDFQVECAGSVLSARGRAQDAARAAMLLVASEEKGNLSWQRKFKSSQIKGSTLFLYICATLSPPRLCIFSNFSLSLPQARTWSDSVSQDLSRASLARIYSSGSVVLPSARALEYPNPAVPWERGCATAPRICEAAISASWRAPARDFPCRN